MIGTLVFLTGCLLLITLMSNYSLHSSLDSTRREIKELKEQLTEQSKSLSK